MTVEIYHKSSRGGAISGFHITHKMTRRFCSKLFTALIGLSRFVVSQNNSSILILPGL